MKNQKLAVALSLGLVALGLCWAGTEPFIRWEWRGQNIVEFHNPDGAHLQFGLRQDGVVVWREITNTTNSPAEIPIIYMSPGMTNIVITNTIPKAYGSWEILPVK